MRRRFLLIGGAAWMAIAGIGGWAYMSATAMPPAVQLHAATGVELAHDESTLLVDIRRPEEWAETGVVLGAMMVTYTDAESFLNTVRPHLKPGQTLSLICRTGNRTSRAAQQIAAAAPDIKVVDIAGGMVRVMREGYKPLPPAQSAR